MLISFILLFALSIVPDQARDFVIEPKNSAINDTIPYRIQSIPLILMDTVISFNSETFEESVMITRNKISTQNYMKEILGVEARNETIDSVFKVNTIDHSVDLFIIDHKLQKIDKVSRYNST